MLISLWAGPWCLTCWRSCVQRKSEIVARFCNGLSWQCPWMLLMWAGPWPLTCLHSGIQRENDCTALQFAAWEHDALQDGHRLAAPFFLELAHQARQGWQLHDFKTCSLGGAPLQLMGTVKSWLPLLWLPLGSESSESPDNWMQGLLPGPSQEDAGPWICGCHWAVLFTLRCTWRTDSSSSSARLVMRTRPAHWIPFLSNANLRPSLEVSCEGQASE